MKALSDHQEKLWLSDLIAGDENAFRLFFDLYHIKLYRFSFQYLKNHQLAEDITQDVFVKIWQERSKLREIQNFDGYLFQLAKWKTIDCLRQIVRDNKIQSKLKVSSDLSCHPIQEFENTKYLERLKKGLTPQQLAVFELSREKGMTYEMIAEELNISKNTVRNHMVEALRYIKRVLAKPFFTISSIFFYFN